MTNERQSVQVAVLLDETGSVAPMKATMISGFNEYIQTLRRETAADRDVQFTLMTFSADPPRPIVRLPIDRQPLARVKDLDPDQYNPDGWTPLYDSIAALIVHMEKSPITHDKHICMIMTDGLENHSKEFTREKIFSMIEARQKLGNWTFVFFGSNQDAWATASSIGVPMGNTVSYSDKHAGATIAYAASRTSEVVNQAEVATAGFASTVDPNQFRTKEDQDKYGTPEEVRATPGNKKDTKDS
jgi:hypothetical protein